MSNTTTSRVRRRPVSFGNPALEQAISVDRTVAMVDVPPDEVPEGIFNLIRAHRPYIQSLRIVIAEPLDETNGDAQGDGDSNTPQSQQQNEQETDLKPQQPQHGQPQLHRSTKERKYLVLIELDSDDAAEEIVEYLHGQPFTSLDETNCCSMHHVIALQGHDGVSLQSPFFASTSKPSQLTPSSKSQLGGGEEETKSNKISSDGDYNCAVCLEHLHLTEDDSEEQSSVLTTVCNHSFHMDCLLKWQESPCPVCRYDHSGLNDALSQCHVCGTTDHNYVCLICGMISCNRPSSGSSFVTPTSIAGITECGTQSAPGTGNANISIPVRISPLSHARRHYDDTLHAYALDTETQHVFDFAGQGYVHRLLQNKDDGKLVEVSDPSAFSEERTQDPGLSETQEEHVVHEKLEGMASAYYTLLKSQLEQQRIYYEGRLEEIRHDNRPKKVSDYVNALKQEKQQLTQRLVMLQSRRNKVREDVAFLTNMVESLEKNKLSFRDNVAAAQKERAEVRAMFENCLPTLQEKVTRLMLQLEADANQSAPAIVDPCNDKKKAASSRK